MTAGDGDAMLAINDKDLGTPARPDGAEVQLEIDGRQVAVPAGTSVLRAAALAGVASGDTIPRCDADTGDWSLASCWSR